MNQNEIANHLEELIDVLADFIFSIDKKKKTFISVPPLFRCQFEASVDLINLCKHENYEKVLYAMHLSQKIKMLQATFENSKNPYFKDTIKNLQNRSDQIKILREELQITKKINFEF